ncbi:MAG: tetratricopeptide repeat protein [Candidatus Brocadiales bacterium]|nr:tetratricopeptide repeat protein [Candidatus Brocadiales bacterium]
MQKKTFSLFLLITLIFPFIAVDFAYAQSADDYFKQGIIHYDKARLVRAKYDASSGNVKALEAFEKKEEKALNMAINAFLEVIKISPDRASAYNNLGVLYDDKVSFLGGDKEKFEQIEGYYTKAITLTPDSSKAYSNRGILYWRYRNRDKAINEQNLDQAIRDYTKAIELLPNYSKAYSNRGIANSNFYNSKHNIEQAMKDFSKAIELDPQNTEAYYALAQTYSAENDVERSTKELNKAIELDPRYKDLAAMFFRPKAEFDYE